MKAAILWCVSGFSAALENRKLSKGVLMVLPLVGRRHARPRGLLATLLVLRPTNND